MQNSFDVIVIGVGSMGSSTCFQLAGRGYKVLGLEQFAIGHEYGSHAGQSRIIRKAYFEDAAYVPLLARAYENWKNLQNETGSQVYFQTGLLYLGPPQHPFIRGVKRSASLYKIPLETLESSELTRRFPTFKIPMDFETLFEPEAGFVTPEKAIRLYADEARKKGAKIQSDEKVIDWEKDGEGIRVTTDSRTYHCSRLVVSAGAWVGKIIPGLSKKIRVTRQFVAWMNPGKWDDFTLDHFPCWLLADNESPGCYYGFPILPEHQFGGPKGLKIAHHHPGQQTDPDNVSRQMTEDDRNDLDYVLGKYFRGKFNSVLSYKICLYANSPDENFIVDKLPGFEDRVVVACGFSGHGFKFASVVGEILADLATEGKTTLPIGFLNAARVFS